MREMKYRGSLEIHSLGDESYYLKFVAYADSGGPFAVFRELQGREQLAELLTGSGLGEECVQQALESLDEDAEAFIPEVVLSDKHLSMGREARPQV